MEMVVRRVRGRATVVGERLEPRVEVVRLRLDAQHDREGVAGAVALLVAAVVLRRALAADRDAGHGPGGNARAARVGERDDDVAAVRVERDDRLRRGEIDVDPGELLDAGVTDVVRAAPGDALSAPCAETVAGGLVDATPEPPSSPHENVAVTAWFVHVPGT